MKKLFFAILILLLCNCIPSPEPQDPQAKCREVHVWYDEEGEFHRELIDCDCEVENENK